MLQIFKTSQLLYSFLFIFYVLVLRSFYVLYPSSFSTIGYGVWEKELVHFVTSYPYAAVIITCCLVVLQAVLLSYLVLEHKIAKEISLFPGVFYILISSIGLSILPLSAVLIANTFFILALINLFSIYKKNSAADKIFNIGFGLAIASLFYPSSILLLLFVISGVSTLRSFNLKEILAILVGFITPYILVGTYYFWNDDLMQFGTNWVNGFQLIDFNSIALNWESYAVLGVFSTLLIFVLFSFGSYRAKKDIQNKKNITILYRAILFIILAALIQNNLNLEHLLLLAVPLGVLLSFTFSDTRNTAIANAVHILFIVAILVFHYYRLFSF